MAQRFLLREDLRLVWQGLKFFGACFFVNRYVAEVTLCQGPSMLPTLEQEGDAVLLEKLSLRWKPLSRDEIVVCRAPHRDNEYVCKRIIALIPRGHVWLEGDNPENSMDSRNYGPVPAALVQGRVVGRVWPPWRSFSLATTRPRRAPPAKPSDAATTEDKSTEKTADVTAAATTPPSGAVTVPER